MNKIRSKEGDLNCSLTLRQNAELALTHRHSQLNLVRSESDLLRLVHELEVHQIELEMQNNELQLAKEQAGLATAKYVELYEFAPLGYFILSREGKIIQLNIAGSQIFGKERSLLKNHPFAFFISNESKPVFKLFLSQVFTSNNKETCDLSLLTPDIVPVQVQLTGFAEPDKDECFVSMVDITERKRNEKEIVLANEELASQNEDKVKRAVELTIANEELAFQNEERAKRAAELDVANKELAIRMEENNRQYSEQISINRVIAFQRDRLEEIASLVPGVVYQFRLHPDGTSCFPYASEAINQIYRVTPEEVCEDATKVFANLHPDDYDGFVASLDTSAKKLIPWQQEYRVKFDDGTIRNLFGNSLPRLEEDGSVLWHGFVTDITDRKLAEESFKKLSTRLQLAARAAGVGIWELDIVSNNLVWDDQMLPLYGIEKKDFSGTYKEWLRLVHPEDVFQSNSECQMAISGEKELNSEFRIVRPNGTIHNIRSHAIVQRDTMGNPLQMIGTNWDITAQKKVEKALQDSEARYRSMTTNISDVISIMGADGLVKYRSPNGEKYFGWAPEERIGTSNFSIIHPDDLDVAQKLISQLLENENTPLTFECRSQCKDGSYKPVEITACNLLNDPLINGILLNYRDISDRKEREQEIKLKNEVLQKLSSERDKFFSIIAHDLRGPLGGFMGITEVMADETNEFTETEKKVMNLDLSRSARNTFNLLENLLEWSQMDRGLTVFKPQELDLRDVVTDCRNIVSESARKKMIELLNEIPRESQVFADKNMLQTVIRNLLSNAIKFTPAGGRVTISAKPAENNMIVISVKDTGIGMSDQMRNDLFTIDANTRRPGTNGEKSTGLGLLLCREFVEKQGGKIWVESEQFKGTVFSFTIPSTGQKGNEIEIPKAEFEEKPAGKINNLKILIAEDDDISAKLIGLIVKGFSREVFNVKTGDDAVKVCRNNPDIDLILMDIAMPGIDGYEATRQIRQFNPEVVIIAQTTFALSTDKEKAIAAGCNDFITKPIGKAALVELIGKHIKH